MRASRARVLSEPLGGSPLSLAVQQRALPSDLQPWWPQRESEWQAHAARVRASAPSGWLEALLPAMAPAGEAAERLQAAAQHGIVVTTGQQAGLFGGPMYTLSKALSALALADTLQERLGVPVAPVFWAATDDADFLEASVVHVADASGVARLALDSAPAPGTPMSNAALGDTTELLRRLHRACGSAAHERYFEMARAAFAGQRTLGAAYVHLLRELLPPLGIAVLDSSHAAVRAGALPVLRRALVRAGRIHAAVAGRSGSIRALGMEPQVEDDRELSLVFTHERGLKRRLSVAEAADADAADAALSPNVLLRPVVERVLLPSAAYVAGPGELAYYAQVSAVSDALETPTPVAVPRWSGTVVEPFTARALERLGVEPRDLAETHAIEGRFARAAMPPSVAEAWARVQQQLDASLDALGSAVRDAALVPMPVVDGLRRSLAHKIGRTERRFLAAAKRRDDQVRRDLDVAAAALYPLGKRQERVLSFVPMLARNGDDLIEDMRRAAGAHAASLVAADRSEPVPVR